MFAKRGMARALGLKSEGGNAFLKTLSGKKLGSEISEELRKKLENPIVFNISGADPGHGFEAEVLVDVCKAVIRADEAGKLLHTQKQRICPRLLLYSMDHDEMTNAHKTHVQFFFGSAVWLIILGIWSITT